MIINQENDFTVERLLASRISVGDHSSTNLMWCIAFYRKLISELWSISVYEIAQCYLPPDSPTQLNAPRFNPSQKGWCSSYLPRIGGSLGVGYLNGLTHASNNRLIATRQGVEPTKFVGSTFCTNT